MRSGYTPNTPPVSRAHMLCSLDCTQRQLYSLRAIPRKTTALRVRFDNPCPKLLPHVLSNDGSCDSIPSRHNPSKDTVPHSDSSEKPKSQLSHSRLNSSVPKSQFD